MPFLTARPSGLMRMGARPPAVQGTGAGTPSNWYHMQPRRTPPQAGNNFDFSQLGPMMQKVQPILQQSGVNMPTTPAPGVGGWLQSFLGGYRGASGAAQGVVPEDRGGLIAELMNRFRLTSPRDWASKTTTTPAA